MVIEWVIYIAAYGYKCEKKEEDLDFVTRYLAVHHRLWIGINGLMWVRDLLLWITSWVDPTCVVR